MLDDVSVMGCTFVEGTWALSEWINAPSSNFFCVGPLAWIAQSVDFMLLLLDNNILGEHHIFLLDTQ